MKLRIVLILFASFFTLAFAQAATVKLKITYKGAPVANSDITIKNGDVSLGSGRTDGNGDVSISASSIISRQIDVYGAKTCGGATKTWDVRGFVYLDDNNFFHLKMEDVMKQMSGMGVSETMLESAWGLSASGCNDSPSSGSPSNAKSTESASTPIESQESADDATMEPINWDQMREDKLQFQRTGLENEIALHQRRIQKGSADLAQLKSDGGEPLEIRRAEIDLQIEKLKKEKKELDLEQVESKLDGPALSKQRHAEIDQRITDISVEIRLLKEEDKELRDQEKEIRQEEKFETMGKLELRKRLADLKMIRTNKKMKLKMYGKTMSKTKREELEAEIEQLDQDVEKYQNRLEELKGEGEDEGDDEE